jgi:hypothetical protein
MMLPLPSASPEDAMKWQQGEIAKWRDVTGKVKIEITQ